MKCKLYGKRVLENKLDWIGKCDGVLELVLLLT